MRVKVTPEAPYFAICVCAEAFLGLEHVTQRLRVASCSFLEFFNMWHVWQSFSCGICVPNFHVCSCCEVRSAVL